MKIFFSYPPRFRTLLAGARDTRSLTRRTVLAGRAARSTLISCPEGKAVHQALSSSTFVSAASSVAPSISSLSAGSTWPVLYQSMKAL